MYLNGAGVACRAGASMRRALRGAFVAALAAFICMAAPELALAEGGVSCTGITLSHTDDAGRPDPDPQYDPDHWMWWGSLQFDKNVSFAKDGADDAFVENNVSKVHLQTADGRDVEGFWAEGTNSHAERQVIYLRLSERLQPATAYRVTVDSGIEAANGADFSSQPYVFEFTTTDDLGGGWTIHAIAAYAVVGLALAAGVGVGCVRVAKRKGALR